MKKEIEIKTKEVPRLVWYVECPNCTNEITGNYREQAHSNLILHMRKCKKGGKKK